ncbi:unnamed protein product [Closterium sp. Yama58-4]|nr:unnamed protein product [Closterium sp. Yama58-4]
MLSFLRRCVSFRDYGTSAAVITGLSSGHSRATQEGSASVRAVRSLRFQRFVLAPFAPVAVGMECVVQGIIESKHVRALAELIEGMTGAREEKLDLHQLVYRNAPNIGAIPCEVRLECPLNCTPPIWTMTHVGGAMRGAGADQLACLVRSIVRVRASPSVIHLVPAIGLRLDHELIRRGSAFDFAHRSHAMRLEAFAPLRLPRQHAVSDAQPLPSLAGLHVVEVTAAAAAAETYTETAAALNSFAETIAP